ncbi:universal stress protein [Ignavibacteria bacterium]|nr:universal stress protein [Bacteroidota bacterium]MCZ2131746.1 universal stress protein [Bacteroidota bacterium]
MASQSILVATDFSECSADAANYAATLAVGLGANIVLAYVADDNVFNSKFLTDKIGTAFIAMTAEQAREAAREIVDAELDALAHTLRKLKAHCSTVILEGSPATALTEFAVKNDCSMIVVGTHGHSNLEHFMYGSVTDRLLRLAGCPVLVVRKKAVPEKKSAVKKK